MEGAGERSTLSRQPDPLAQVACRAGDSSCAVAHADTLSRATDSQPSRGGQSLVQLQRQYGNRFVQRVLAVSKKADGATEVAPEVEQAVQAARGGGQALDTGMRAQMESAFGADFSGVRVHADAGSDALNQSLNARAFTTGQDVFFRQGAYDPGSSGGRELLAHELTHVVQQTGDEVQRKLTVNAAGDRYEQEADRVARAIVRQEQEPVQKNADERLMSRQVEEEEKDEPLQARMEDGWVQRQEEEPEDEEPIQAQAATGAAVRGYLAGVIS
ncbi:MAG: DUF4157 domain-containing protein [Anaerolineae bacterium]|nr:DUF4157 domain-containing protein [Anaerolineae bacterium]